MEYRTIGKSIVAEAILYSGDCCEELAAIARKHILIYEEEKDGESSK